MRQFKDKIASGLGSILEWYDFALYTFFSPLITELYFPNTDSSVGLLKVLLIFAIGFFARPFGGLIFGYISDKHGRTLSLKLTPILITLPTFLFSILPTYEQIGIYSTIFLVILRICQGICIGGEYANNIVYLCESIKSKQTYFFGSLGSCTASFGIFLASIIVTFWYMIFSHHALLVWGWRIAFSLSLLIGIAIYIIRKNMNETPIFKNILKNKAIIKNPIKDSFKSQWKICINAIGLTFLPATAFYYVFMFLPTYLNNLGINASKISNDSSLSLLLRLLIIPLIGILADKIGGIKIARLSCISFLLFSFPLFYGLNYFPSNANYFLIGFALLTTMNAGTTPGLLMEMLNPQTRCTIFSFTFNFCFGVFGGIVPFISFLLVKKLNNEIASIYYLVFASIVTFIATFFFKKGNKIHD